MGFLYIFAIISWAIAKTISSRKVCLCVGWRKGVWVNKKLAAVSVPVRPDDLQQDDAEQQAGARLHPGVSGAPGDGLAVGLQLQRGECAQEGPRQGAHRRRPLLRGGGRGPDHHRHRQRLRRRHRQGTYLLKGGWLHHHSCDVIIMRWFSSIKEHG